MRRRRMVFGFLVGALVLLVALGIGLKGEVLTGVPPPDYWPGEEWPARALEVSGKTYRLEQNPVGWKTLRFDFSVGTDVARLTIDGNPVLPAIGLDNRYRLWSPGKDQPLAGLRGCWEGKDTLRVEQVSLGQLPESDSLVRFQGDQLVATIADRVFGGEQTLRGRVEAN